MGVALQGQIKAHVSLFSLGPIENLERRVDIQPNQVENSPHIEIENLLGAPIGRRFKRATPCSSGIGNKNIEFRFCFLDFIQESFDILGVSAVGRNTNSRSADRELVQLFNCLINALWAAGLSG
jgi:hypothetical protein